MKTIRSVFFTVLFGLALENCAVPKDGSHNRGILAMDLVVMSRPQALVYIANQGSGNFGVNVLQVSMTGAVSLLPGTSFGTVPGGLTATGIGSGHVLSTVKGANQVAILDARQGSSPLRTLSVGTNPNTIYVDPANTDHNWLLNDGNGIGADPILCSATQGSFTVIHDSSDPVLLAHTHANLCVGKGPHDAASQTQDPKLAMVTNQGDNTVSVIDNSEDSPTFLSQTGGVLNTITLASKPKGMVYSSLTNLFYTYLPASPGSIAVIDPTGNGNTGALGTPIASIGTTYSVLKLDTMGQFLILAGTDTSTSPNKGTLQIVNVSSGAKTPVTVGNVGFSDVQQSPDGKLLFVSTASTDASTSANLMYVYDSSNLPNLNLLNTIPVGKAATTYRTFALNSTGNSVQNIFVPNFSDGTISVIDGKSYTVTNSFTVGGNPSLTTIFQPGGATSSMNMGGMNGM